MIKSIVIPAGTLKVFVVSISFRSIHCILSLFYVLYAQGVTHYM